MGTTILKVSSSNSFFMSKIFSKKNSSFTLSTLSDTNEQMNKQYLFIKNRLSKKYKKIDDELLNYINYKVYYIDTLVSTISLGGDNEDINSDTNPSLITIEVRKKNINREDDKDKSLEYAYYFVEKKH
jgi:hypothetical protein